MSEEIYAWLWRLFPSDFRERYGNEALQLFRDRSRDEKGFVPRLRLWLDLVVDLAISVFRQRRFAQPAPIGTSALRNCYGTPSFHALRAEPPRLFALLLGSVLSMFALGAFPMLISHSGHRRLLEETPASMQPRGTGDGLGSGSPNRSAFFSNLLLLLDRVESPGTSIPDTPAGRALRAWLDAFNSGDPAKIEHFEKTLDPARTVIFQPDFRRRTGGFNLLSVTSKDAWLVTFRVKEKNSSTQGMGSIRIKDGQPATVSSFSIRALPPGALIEDVKLDAAERKHVIDGVISNLKQYYVYPDLAQKMADALLAHERAGDDNAETDGALFAELLTKQLRDVSHDRHLNVFYSPFKAPEHPPAGPEDDAQFRKQLERDNCSFQKLEILPHNIGYLKFNAFPPPSLCRPTVEAAMGFLANVDAIIFDLRDNHGGDPNMVALIATYLFDRPTHLNDIYNRRENSTQQYWTLANVRGKRLADKPAYVLTSTETFSGAEEFTYDLKNLKRATLVGETTGGGAHLTNGHQIDDHFGIAVPFARPINPVSKKDWEGTGVEPDVKVKAADALETAEKLAESKLQEK